MSESSEVNQHGKTVQKQEAIINDKGHQETYDDAYHNNKIIKAFIWR